MYYIYTIILKQEIMKEAIVGFVLSGTFIYFYWWLSGKTTKKVKENRTYHIKSNKIWIPNVTE